MSKAGVEYFEFCILLKCIEVYVCVYVWAFFFPLKGINKIIYPTYLYKGLFHIHCSKHSICKRLFFKNGVD